MSFSRRNVRGVNYLSRSFVVNVVSQQPQPCWPSLPSTQEGDSGWSGCMGESVLAHWLTWDWDTRVPLGGCPMESAAPRAGLCRRLNRSAGVGQAS